MPTMPARLLDFRIDAGAASAARIQVADERDLLLERADSLPAIAGAGHLGVALDHMDPDSLRQGFAAAEAVVPQIDILVNNGLELIAHD